MSWYAVTFRSDLIPRRKDDDYRVDNREESDPDWHDICFSDHNGPIRSGYLWISFVKGKKKAELISEGAKLALNYIDLTIKGRLL